MSRAPYTWDDVSDDGTTLTLPDGVSFDYVSDMSEYLERCEGE